jgi:sugar phosphate permease
VTGEAVSKEAGAEGRAGGRWTSRRALIAHGVLAIWIPGCVAACWWQVTVALSGDSLGWIYSVMWPTFGVFGIVLWWHIVHDDPETVGARGLERLRREAERATLEDEEEAAADDVIARAEAEDDELAAYNAYLAELREGPDTKTWRRR